MVLPVGDAWGVLWPFHGAIHSIELKFLRYVFACNADRQVTVSSVVLPRGQQFKVEREENGAYVTDLEGFGTLLNEIRLRVGGKALLKHADRVSIKSSSFMGVLVLELSKAMRKELGEDSNRYQSHLPASYVKFVEGSGGRVVPIMIGRKKKYYKNLMKSLNGVLFPGGAVNFEDADGYAAAGANLLDLATEANQNGDYFPVWGTCLGFQLLTYLAAGRREHRADCYSTQQTLPLEFRTDFRDSKMFRNAPDHVIEILKTKDVNANFHSYCVTEKNMTKMGLIPDWRILATNHDLNGLEFVSVIESRDFPYYGVIAHPEKNPYEFNPTRNYPHSAGAVVVAQFFANFFVDEARKSSHQFSEPTEERESLIYNFEPVHTGARSIFEQTYFFRE